MSANVYGDTIVGSQKMNLGDSSRLFKSLSVLDLSIIKDQADSNIFNHETQFSTLDNAFSIVCKKTVKIVDLETECIVNFDSSLSQPNVTDIFLGAAKGAVIININNLYDVRALKNSATNPFGYFQSTEKIEAELPEAGIGFMATFSKLRIDCQATTDSCQVAFFPKIKPLVL